MARNADIVDVYSRDGRKHETEYALVLKLNAAGEIVDQYGFSDRPSRELLFALLCGIER